MDTLLIIMAGVGTLGLLAITIIISRLYRRATSELAFVRTGQGGRTVVHNGGKVVVPLLHDMIWVNMNTLRLEVQRNKEEALITKDRMRVDVRAEFYVQQRLQIQREAEYAQIEQTRELEIRKSSTLR